ncbi:28S ribosomal protein S24, mitochondrial, partial [Fragariocoptes setiger]
MVRGLHTSTVLCRKRAGRHKVSRMHDKPLTYEEANKPNHIGVRKMWNSFDTSALENSGHRTSETAQEDVFIRKFLQGTWHRLVLSDPIIKRRANQIILTFMALRAVSPSRTFFLIGYTEEMLSLLLKSVVKLEIQTLESKKDLVYKYI